MEVIITDYSRHRPLEIHAIPQWDPIRKDLNFDGKMLILVYTKGSPLRIPEKQTYTLSKAKSSETER